MNYNFGKENVLLLNIKILSKENKDFFNIVFIK